jgi:aspartate aminotransferase
MVCNPSNPTGTVFTPDELQRLVTIAIAHDLFIITDEVYREFAFDAPIKSLMQFPEAADRVILTDSASKRFNLCGARLGVLASRNPDIMAAALRLGMARLSVATIEQQAIIPVLEQAQTIIPPVVEEYRKRRDLVFEKLSAIPGVVTSKPEGAFYNICALPVDSAEQFVRWTIEEFADNTETVLLAPAAGFYATPGMGQREIRLAYVLNCDKLTRALEVLQIALEQSPNKI